MRTFDIYTRNDGASKAVKKGWSWPAFFFGSLWALSMQLWLIGILLLPVELILQMFVSFTEQQQKNASASYSEILAMVGGVIALVGLGIRIIFGSYGNSWKRKRLERVGYSHDIIIKARSKADAISLVANNSIQSTPASERC